MAIESSVPQSRRALLAGALGGLAAAVAGALGRPGPASAAAGSTMIIGSETNDAGSANTQLLTNSNVVAFKLLQNGPGTALMGYATPATGATRGVYGRSDSPNGYGVQARNAGAAGTGAAMQAIGVNNIGLEASTDSATSVALKATNSAVDGTVALFENTSGGTGDSAGPALRAYTAGGSDADVHPEGDYNDAAGEFAGRHGVIGASTGIGYGVLGLSPSGAGVYGVSNDSYGVRGSSVSNYGVYGSTDAGTGVRGISTSGYGVYGNSSSLDGVRGFSTTGYAVHANGRARIDEYLDIQEMAAPASPAVNVARLFVRDNGAGKTELCVIFPTGAVQVIKTQA
jgi:hypothetical protein